MRLAPLCFLLAFAIPSISAFGQSPSHRTPSDCHIYLEFADAKRLVERIESTLFAKAILAHPAYADALSEPGLSLAKNIWGVLAPYLKGETGVGLRFSATGPAVFLSAKHGGAIDLEELAQQISSLSKDFEITKRGKKKRITWITLGKGGIIGADDRFLYWGERPSSLREVGRLEKKNSMGESPRFRLMKKTSKKADFMFLVNTSELLDGESFAEGKLKEALEILLFQGFLEDVDASVFAFGYGSWTDQLKLHVRLMNREKRASKWNTSNRIRTPAKSIDGEMARLYFDRDLAQFWQQRSEIIPEAGKAGLAGFSQTINIFLAGFPFDQLMARTKGGLEIVVANREAIEQPSETILPSFAMVVDTSFSDDEQQRFQVAFQTAIGVVNADAEQTRRQPMLQGSRMVQGVNILTAHFLDDPQTKRKKIEYNFTPSLAFANHKLILSSDLSLASKLVQRCLTESKKENNGKKVRGDSIELAGPVVGKMLALNRIYFLDQRILDAGEDEVEAAQFVDGLLRIVKTLKRVSMRHIVLEGSTVWELNAQTAEIAK